MNKVYSGVTVETTEDGYLKNFGDWNKEVAAEIAQEEGVTLTDAHWKVLEYVQNQYRNGNPLSIRSIGKSGIVDIKQFYDLFPGGPLKKASRIAGIPKPASCI